MKITFAILLMTLSLPAFAESNFENCMNAQEEAQLATAKAQITCQYEELGKSATQNAASDSRCETQRAEAQSAANAAEQACSNN